MGMGHGYGLMLRACAVANTEIVSRLHRLKTADMALLAPPISAACEALLKLVRSKANPQGMWHAKPKDVRQVNGLKLQVTAGHGESSDLRILTCLVCFDDYPALQGIECTPVIEEVVEQVKPLGWLPNFFGGPPPPPPVAAAAAAKCHFLCDECLAGHVGASIDHSNLDTFRQRGGVCCVAEGCKALPFADAILAKMLPLQNFENYLKAKEIIAEQRINAELEEGFEARLMVERNKAGDHARQVIKDHIVEKILTLACPRCGQAFIDFNGCWALYCGRPGCGCGFCAICQEDCQGPETAVSGGDPAHKHVASCPLLKRIGMADKVHQGGGTWEEASRKAKMLMLKDYLGTLTETQRQHALTDCERELRDLQINPADLGKAEEAPKEDGAGAAFAAAFAQAVGGGDAGALEVLLGGGGGGGNGGGGGGRP